MVNQPPNAAPQEFIHWFSFKKLPPEIQQRLVNLQNGEGDYIKRKQSGSGCFIAVAFAFIFIWFFVFSIGAQMVLLGGFFIIYFLTFLVFLITSYFIIQVIIDSRIPLKAHTFITPTQIIDANGDVIQAANIAHISSMTHVETRNRKGGRFSNLEVKFPDNSMLRFSISGNSEAVQIMNRVNAWNNLSRNAVLQGDQSYFQRHNIFQGIPYNDFHLYKYQRGCLRHFLIGVTASLLLTTLIVVPVSGLIWYRSDAADWNDVTQKKEKNIGSYKYYLEKHPYGLHRQEAAAELERSYGEIIERAKSQTANGADQPAIDALIQVLENAKSGRKNLIAQLYEHENKISSDAEKKLNGKLGSSKILPIDGNLTDISLTTIEKNFGEQLVSRFKNTYPESAIRLDNYNDYTKNAPSDSPVLKIRYTVEVNENDKPKSTVKTYEKETAFYPAMTVSFDCDLNVPDKSSYRYNFKSVPTPDFTVYSKKDSSFYQNLLKKAFSDFENDFARRFGLKEAETEKK